tara:strand:+ start:1765 stop:3492 length:1728 start_codon:yes stop_codon:yes gene_type:complete
MNNIIESVFKELIDKGVLIVEKKQPEETESKGEGGVRTVLKLPKFKINEKNWGTKLDTEDRAIIEQIGANLEGDDPLSRIDYVNNFLESQSEIKGDITVGKVMGTLMFLDIFASIVYEFNASVAGFLFEAMFAGIFEGEQIEAKLGGGEAGTTDVVLYVGKGTSKKGVEYSFKLLGKGATTIQGSAADILSGIRKASDAKEVYLIGLKSEDSKKVMTIDFYEFDVTKETWFDWIGAPVKDKVPDIREFEFVFGSEESPEFVKLPTAAKKNVGKRIDGEFVIKPTRKGSKSKSSEEQKQIEQAIKDYADDTSEELFYTTRWNKSKLSFTDEQGNPVEMLIQGQKYKGKVLLGTKLGFKRSKNYVDLYGPYLKEGAFEAEVEGEKYTNFDDYVASGAYVKDDKFFDRLALLPAFQGGKGTQQFIVRQSYLESKGEGVRGPNTVTLDREKFQQAAARYTNVIGDKIYRVFTDMANLVEDVSGYYLGNTVKERFEMGLAAKEEAERLAKSTEENFKEIEVEEETRKALEKSAYRRAARRGATSVGTISDVPIQGRQEEAKVIDLNDFSKKILENIKKTS